MKKLIAILLAVCTVFSLCVPAFAAKNEAQAESLHALGLLQGTENGYDLEKPLTREQGVVMILRLLGKEAQAQKNVRKHPFSDLGAYAWVEPYVGYAYHNGVTKGLEEKRFGYGEPMTEAMFLTMLLRVLGYKDKEDGSGDFSWRDPYALSKTIALSDGEAHTPFLRDDMALACWNALRAKRKGAVGVLAGDLIREGVFTVDAYKTAGGASAAAVPEITPVAPSGEIDAVSAKLRDYLARAEAKYATGDCSETVKGSKETFDPEPVVFQWKCANPGSVRNVLSLAIELSQKADFSDCRIVPCTVFDETAEVQSEPVYNLFTGASYYWRIVSTSPDGTVKTSDAMTFTTKPGPRILKIDGVDNARDLGGWPTLDGGTTPEGRVYRTARLEEAKPAGVKTILEELAIVSELDLRNPAAKKGGPDTSLKGTDVRYHVHSGKSYKSFITKPKEATEALRLFSKPDAYPILFHCQVGKDRTGAIGYILNGLAGVSERDLFIDYEISPQRFVSGYKSYKPSAYLEAFRKLPGETVREKAQSFLAAAGLNAMEIHNIEMLIKNDAAVFTDPEKLPEAQQGVVKFSVDARASGALTGVKQGSAELPFTFENGELSVTVTGGNSAEATFADGTRMPLLWK